MHGTLFEVRSKLYAHTDEDYRNRRKTIDLFGNHKYVVQYAHLSPDRLPEIRAFALALADRFRRARQDREQALRDAGVEPERYEGPRSGVVADYH